MSNPYQIPPSDFQGDSPSSMPTGLSGFSLRRSSYASVASGGGSFGRSSATFQQLLNTSNPDGNDGNGASDSHNGLVGGGSLRPPYTSIGAGPSGSNDADAAWPGIGSTDTQLLQWFSRSSPLPPHSRAFEPYLRGPLYDGFGSSPSNNSGFFTPSYLRESVYVQRLEDQYKAKMEALRESQRQQQLHSGQPASSASGATAAAAAATATAGAGGVFGSSLGNLDGGAGLGAHSIAGPGGPGSKFGPGSHRGLSYDVIEKVSGSSSLLDDDELITPLPSRWAKNNKVFSLDVLSNGLEVMFTAPKSADRDQEVSSIRADHHMPQQCGIYYFEITILSKKREESTIGIGFSDADSHSGAAAGFEPGSWGYHSDDGNVFSDHGPGKHYGPSFGTGDVIGCGVNFRTGTAFYTKNGEDLGTAFRDIEGTNMKLYPTVSLKKSGEHIWANFGQARFIFDIDGLMSEHTHIGEVLQQAIISASELVAGFAAPGLRSNNVLQYAVAALRNRPFRPYHNIAVLNFPVYYGPTLYQHAHPPCLFCATREVSDERAIINQQIHKTSTDSLVPSLDETNLIQQLVLQFLQHDGYVETARAFAGEIQSEKEALNLDPTKEIEGINIADDEDANKRQSIRQAVLEGNIDRALELTNDEYPDVLSNNDDVLFRLKCRKFIEMIRREAELNIVGGGNTAVSSDASKQVNGHGRQRSQQTPHNMDVDDIDMVEDGTDSFPETQALATAAIEYGQALQAQYAGNTRPEIRSALSQIFSLLAYTNPLKQREVAHLLDQKGRVAVAEELNSAILRSLGKSSRSAFETVYAQTSVLLEELRQDGGPGCFITVNSVMDDIPKSYI